MNNNKSYFMLIQVRYTDPRSQEAAVLSNALTSFVTCDQGSVAPTSQSQRYYDKILTILSDPRPNRLRLYL